MKHGNRISPVSRIVELMAVMTLVAVGSGLIGAAAAPATKPADSPMVSKCKADLAKRFKLQVRDIGLIEAQPTTWPDASLGMPEAGKLYAQVETPGMRITLEARSSRYLYTASAKAFRYGGPISIWSCSMLYSKRAPGEPNLNGDLYQCSLMGTNSVRLVSGVTDFYPHEQGIVIFKRRTSRSSHDLLYVRAGSTPKTTKLRSAFDFGDAAINSAQDRWAGYVRPMVGAAWGVVVAPIGRTGPKEQTLPLPDGVQPGRIAWSGEMLTILARKDKQTVCFESSPGAAVHKWKEVGVHTFPGLPDFMLNKSETLEINQIKENGKPAVEVARVWFTGDRNVKAKIPGLTMRGSDLLCGDAFIWGQSGSEAAAYTVDISTGEILPGFHGTGLDIRPFAYPPHGSAMVTEKSK